MLDRSATTSTTRAALSAVPPDQSLIVLGVPRAQRPADGQGALGRPLNERPGEASYRLREVPFLVGVSGAVPDLQLSPGCGRPVGVIETPSGLGVVQRSVRFRDEPLRSGVIALIQVHRCSVCGAAGVDVHALAEGLQRAAGLYHGPLLCVG